MAKVFLPRIGLILSIALVLAHATSALAQESTIVGTVTDSTDAVLPGVTITALKLDNGNTFIDVSGTSGGYRLALRPGTYKITAELTGFTQAVRDNVELQVGSRMVLDLRMTLSTVAESVTVTGETPLVDIGQSKLGGNIDRRQVEELPVNGRNFLDLSMLAPGSRANAVVESPLERENPSGGGAQINVDGQQVTNLVSTTGFGQPRYSKDVIAEFELITNRFDALQGHSSGVQVNVITKSGTNRFGGSLSGYFRNDKFNAEDFIVKRVLPYSDQQVSATFGGPIRKDKLHFFANYEYERNPQTYVFTTPYPLFNKEDLTGDQTLFTTGLKIDYQVNPQNHAMVRAYRYHNDLPYDPRNTGGGSQTISAAATTERSSDSLFASLSKTFGSKAVNEVKVGYNSFFFSSQGIRGNTTSPRIMLLGLTMGKPPNYPQALQENRYSVRDDLTLLFSARGRHEFKVGGEFMYNNTNVFWWQAGDGILTANGGPIPANIEQLFPNQYDPSTWNLAGLSKVTVRWSQSFGEHTFDTPVKLYSTWVQDNWTVSPRLTANLGLRYEVVQDALGEQYVLAPFMPSKRHAALGNIAPRLGAAYNFNDGKTVLRGGWGLFFAQPHDRTNFNPAISILTASPASPNDGRANFAADPYNGRPPTIAEAFATVRDVTGSLVSPDILMPFSYQSSIGVQHQLSTTTSFQADYVYTGARHELRTLNANLSYRPDGVNNPYTTVALRPVPNWGIVPMQYSDGLSNDHGLQTALSKRFSNRWQASATYTLSGLRDGIPCPVVGLACPKDLGGDYTLAATDQRHRFVVNGIVTLPYDTQLSGLYFFGSGLRYATSFGGDRRLLGSGGSARLAADGSIVPRNDFVGTPLHRVDARLLKRVTILGKVKVDGMFEIFNLFNHENDGAYVTTTSSANYGAPQQNAAVAYQPRIMQLGFRIAF